MSLSDLRALARHPTPANPLCYPSYPRINILGNTEEALKTKRNRQFSDAVTSVTHVTHGSSNTGVDERTAPAVKATDIRTKGELWAEAYRRDLQQQPPGLLEAVCEAAAQDGVTEPDGPLWPDPGTPERERLDRKNKAIVAGLLIGWERHRKSMTILDDVAARLGKTLHPVMSHTGDDG